MLKLHHDLPGGLQHAPASPRRVAEGTDALDGEARGLCAPLGRPVRSAHEAGRPSFSSLSSLSSLSPAVTGLPQGLVICRTTGREVADLVISAAIL
jgi:hypothetical protein